MQCSQQRFFLRGYLPMQRNLSPLIHFRLLLIVGTCCWFLMPTSSLWADNWPQWLGPQRDGVWRETGILDKYPPGGPRVVWKVPIGGGYCGPAVADGRVYVMDRQQPPA